MINYSIIIPHKNIPDLLQRCLDSIPRRDDVQIIVVDDNSDADKVNFNNFPGLNDPHVEVIFGKNENGRKGAGYARNLGLERAEGKWIVFADADDFFNPCFEEALDKYENDKNDIVFFKATSVDSDTFLPCDRGKNVNFPLAEVQKTGNWDLIIKIAVPWGKFIKRNIVEENNIMFQETLYGNDVLFSVKLGTLDTKKIISDDEIYCITYRSDSLTGNDTIESIKIRFNVACESVNYSRKRREYKYLVENIYDRWIWIYKKDKALGLKLLPKVLNTSGFIIFKYVRWKDIYNIKQTFLWQQLRKMKNS